MAKVKKVVGVAKVSDIKKYGLVKASTILYMDEEYKNE
jgi:hypothetical protein